MTASSRCSRPSRRARLSKGVLSLAGAGALLLAFACPAHAAFGYRKQLTVNAGLVVTGPIADFPVLVSITDPVNLKTVANGGHVANGADFQFRGEDVGTCNGPASCRLDFEIERYDGATGTLVAWVRVPRIDDGRSIYLSYGDASIGCSQQSRAAVWDPTYREVFHLGETGDSTDSTSNRFTAVTKGTVTQGVAGKIGLAARFHGPAESRLIASDGLQTGNTSFTLEAWVSFASIQPGVYSGIVTKGRESGNAGVGLGDWIGLYKDGTADRLAMGWQCCNVNKPSNLVDGTTVLAINTWYHLVGLYDGLTGYRWIYINGALAAADTVNVARYASIPQFLRIGDDSNGQFHDGLIDEVRLAKDMRPANWVATSFNNQGTPGTFFTVNDVAAGVVTGTACPAANPCSGGPGTCNLRSIGTRADYGTLAALGAGTQVSVTGGSIVVTGTGGTGTQWVINNRGRGDRITINGVDYTVAAVDSNTQLRLTVPFAAASGTYNYTIARKFKGTTTSPLADWENCIDGPASGAGCEGITSISLVDDSRSEIGIVYADGASYTFPAAGQEILTIQGSTTDSSHTITLTADPGNRHLGIAGAGVVLDNTANTTTAIRIQDNFVTLEWLELMGGGSGTGVHGIDFVPSSATGNAYVCRNNLIHTITGQALRVANVSPFVGVADISGNIIYRNDRAGIQISNTLLAGSRVRVLNNTLFRNNSNSSAEQIGSGDTTGTNPFVVLRNNVFVADGFDPDVSVPWPNVGSSHNITGDLSPLTAPCNPGPPPGGACYQSDLGSNPRGSGQYGRTEASLKFVDSADGTENLHIQTGSSAIDAGANLMGFVFGDIDGIGRSAPWDVGADDFTGLPAVGAGCPAGTAPTGPNKVFKGDFDLGDVEPAGGPTGNGFTTSVPYTDFDCPGDTEETIRTTTGACAGVSVAITQFPGDPPLGIAAAPNSLYFNGNGTGGPAVAWRQTVAGLLPNTTYTFFLYASNGNDGTVIQPPILPTLRFCKGVTGSGPYDCATTLSVADFQVPNETDATDVWRRYQVSFTTGAGETSADLAVLDAAPGLFGDDVQMTQLGVQACGPTTAVTVMSFEAVPSNSAVSLAWQTGSEVDNLGFHLHRSLSAGGPWTRLTSSLIPGQGFSATGDKYTWRDADVANGTRYYYRLEDVDTRSLSTFHGPVSALPLAAPLPGPPESGGGPRPGGPGSGTGGASSCPAWALAQLGSSTSYTCETHGEPASSFRVLSPTSRSALVELETAGFVTARDATGRVRALLPGFDSLSDPLAPALPLKRARIDALVGRQARIGAVQARESRFFPGLRAAAVGYPRPVVAKDGTVQAGRGEGELGISRGVFPRVQARLAGEGFQGEEKTLALELLPVRYDASRGALVLSRKLTVRIDFAGALPSETGQGRLGRHVPRPRPDSSAYAFLATSQKGLHSVAFEAVFPGRSRPVDLATLRLTRGTGVSVPFFVLPQGSAFGPGGRLFFHVDTTASSLSFSPEVVYALERGAGGAPMSLVSAPPDASQAGSSAVSSRGLASFEINRAFAPDILDIEDLWQWESIGSGVSKTKPFALDGLDASSSETARLVVFLQGGSDAVSVVDHHVQVFVGGALVADETFDGAVPHRLEADVPVSLLATANELTVTNVGDTGVASRVFLDRFEILYPQVAAARSGAFDGVFSSTGTAEVEGLAPVALLDVTSGASWLTSYEPGPTLRFRAEAGHRYLAVSPEALLAPRVFFPEPSARLRSKQNQADYVLVAPKAFLGAAQPLLERREAQGLTTFAASLEEIASSFGGGQPSAEAIRDFLSFAFHQWRRPSPRYVLLLGDSNHDPRRFNPASQPSPMPFLLQKTSYIWTASDPALAAVNGDDSLPDLAIGRLPATTLEQAETMVGKILDWEAQGQNLDGKAALVADNPDPAGDFEADARDIEASFLTGRETTRIFLGQLPNRDVARSQILDAFNQGLSLISYVGHGGGAVWANENMLNSADPASLLAQPRQPFMLTMNCLNGYFITPFYESLAEGFLKAEGKGTIGSFSPSGLSLDGPAHVYHRAVMQEITGGRHVRLGDGILAAQKTYAQSGAFPELISIYHLFGDPATKIGGDVP